MSQITIVEIEGQLVVDSRLIAEQLGVEHRYFVRSIKTHKLAVEANFGVVRFENSKPSEATLGGRPEVFCWLTESQATFLMTLSRNTPEVIRCKVGLVKAFHEQKKRLEDPIDRKLFNELANRLAALEAKTKPALPPSIPEPTYAALTKELITKHVVLTGMEYQSAWSLLYRKFSTHYEWKANPKSALPKIKQIEQAGLIEELYQLALKLF